MSVVDMSSNIMANWKSSRFVIASDHVLACLDTLHLIVLTDMQFWSEHAAQLTQWCQTHDAKVAGMTVEIPTEELVNMFVLRWS